MPVKPLNFHNNQRIKCKGYSATGAYLAHMRNIILNAVRGGGREEYRCNLHITEGIWTATIYYKKQVLEIINELNMLDCFERIAELFLYGRGAERIEVEGNELYSIILQTQINLLSRERGRRKA